MMDDFRLGVTGHRPHKLNAARLDIIAGDLQRVLARAQAALKPRRVVCVTSLAEGADTMAAQAALGLGLGLIAPLPFPADDYVQDFADGEPRRLFRTLLGQAECFVCTTGRAALDEDAYGYRAASFAMLDRSHALISVWDGRPTTLLGGAFDTMSEALGRGMKVLWVDATGEQPPLMLTGSDLGALSEGYPPQGTGDEAAFLAALA